LHRLVGLHVRYSLAPAVLVYLAIRIRGRSLVRGGWADDLRPAGAARCRPSGNGTDALGPAVMKSASTPSPLADLARKGPAATQHEDAIRAAASATVAERETAPCPGDVMPRPGPAPLTMRPTAAPRRPEGKPTAHPRNWGRRRRDQRATSLSAPRKRQRLRPRQSEGPQGQATMAKGAAGNTKAAWSCAHGAGCETER
jgi:hypothetical protein